MSVKLLELARTYAGFVKLAHTVFALPFALAALVCAHAWPLFSVLAPVEGQTGLRAEVPVFALWSWPVLGFVLCAMVGARSFAMALNRIVDRAIDARNPRTQGRELVTGRVTPTGAWAFALGSAALYLLACAGLGPVTLWLSPVPLLLMFLYPYTKRFTWGCHLVLGCSLGLAPVGAWVAARAGGSLLLNRPELLGWDAVREPFAWILGGAVALWVAGFDVIYALQDDEFDRAQGLHSIPARFGRSEALWIARVLHQIASVLFFFFLAKLVLIPQGLGAIVNDRADLHWLAWGGPVVMALGMAWQHALVKPDDLRRVNLAFFTVNGVVAVAFLGFVLGAWLLQMALGFKLDRVYA